MPGLVWSDSVGTGILSNSKTPPGNRLTGWTPRAAPIGPAVTALGTARLHRFRFRTDYLAEFEIAAIPAASMELMLRLQIHLLNGGIVAIEDTLAEHITSSRFAVAALAPGTEPEITFSDRAMLEYTFRVTLVSSSGDASGDFFPYLIPGLLMDLDPNALTGIVPADALTGSCPDVSGNSKHATQADTARWPIFREAVLNGYPAIETIYGASAATNDWLMTPEIGTPTSPGGTIFYVGRRVGTANEHDTFFRLATVAVPMEDFNRLAEQWPANPTQLAWRVTQTGVQLNPAGAGPSTDWFIYTIKFTSASLAEHYFNGTSLGTFDPHTDANSVCTFLLGSNESSGIQHGRALWWGSALVNSDINDVLGYLATRYDLAVATL